MRHYFNVILFWVVLTGAAFSGHVHAGEPVNIVVDAYNPPNMFLHDGHAAGLYPILINAIFARMNQDVAIDAVPWKRAMTMGAQGSAGVGGIYKTRDRLLTYDYSDPIHNELLLVYVKRGREFKFDTIEDLTGKKIGVILGWSYGARFDKARADGAFKVEEVNRDQLNFRKLLDERLDCVVASKDSALFEMTRNASSNITALETPLQINPTYVAFAKDANKKEILARFNAALKEMKENGLYKQLVEKFIKRMGPADRAF